MLFKSRFGTPGQLSRLLILILLVLFVLSGSTASFAKNKLESWYTYWGIGYANPSYPSELQEVLDRVKTVPGTMNLSLSLDLLGFYFPLGEKTILGVILNAWGDRYQADYQRGNDYMHLNGYLYSASFYSL